MSRLSYLLTIDDKTIGTILRFLPLIGTIWVVLYRKKARFGVLFSMMAPLRGA